MSERYRTIAYSVCLMLLVLVGSVLVNYLIDGWVGSVAGVVWGGIIGWNSVNIIDWAKARCFSKR